MFNTFVKTVLANTVFSSIATFSVIVGIGFAVSPAQGSTIVTSKRIFQNISANMKAEKVDITLPNAAGGNGYDWLKLIEVNNPFPGNSPPFNITIPMDKMFGGTLNDIMPNNFNIDPTRKLAVITSAKKKDSPLPASKVVFKKLDGTQIGIDDKPETPKVNLRKVGSHDSTTDGFGGSSEFAMVLSNLSTVSVEITGFQLFQNIEMIPFISALESTMLPDDLYTDPINVIGTGEIVGNIMSNFTLNPGQELAFHFDADFDPNLIGISSGFCNGDFECSDSAMTPVPEHTSSLSILALGTLGAASTLKRKLKPSQSTEKDTTKVG